MLFSSVTGVGTNLSPLEITLTWLSLSCWFEKFFMNFSLFSLCNFQQFDNHEGQHSRFRKKTKRINYDKTIDKLVVEKFPVVANFHDVIKSCRDRNATVILFTLSVPN